MAGHMIVGTWHEDMIHELRAIGRRLDQLLVAVGNSDRVRTEDVTAKVAAELGRMFAEGRIILNRKAADAKALNGRNT